jgi:hypothetical protein
MIGILLALQVNNWNESRKEDKQEELILQKLELELSSDVDIIQRPIDFGREFIKEINFCLDVLSNRKQATNTEFHENFSSMLVKINFNMNRTTFDGITESRAIDFLKNTQLVDSLNTFYNTDYLGWDDAIKDYTRNVIGPYLMDFDHIPSRKHSKNVENIAGIRNGSFSYVDVSQFEIPRKTIQDYKKSIFIHNLLRQRLWLVEGQVNNYERLQIRMKRLIDQITQELNHD